VRLKTSVGAVTLNTPFILASGYITETPDFFLASHPHGCAAMVTRSLKKIIPPERARVPAPRYVVIGGDTMLNCEWGNELPWEHWREKSAQQVKATGAPIVISLSGRDPNGCVHLIHSFDEIGVDAFEINVSCSHSGALHGDLNTDLENMGKLLTLIRPHTRTPIWIKLSYSTILLEMARQAEGSGADAIVCTNTIGPGLLLDTKTGKPMLFVEIEDLTGKLEALVFANTLEANPIVWQEGKIVMINGRISDKDEELKILCNEAEELKK